MKSLTVKQATSKMLLQACPTPVLAFAEDNGESDDREIPLSGFEILAKALAEAGRLVDVCYRVAALVAVEPQVPESEALHAALVAGDNAQVAALLSRGAAPLKEAPTDFPQAREAYAAACVAAALRCIEAASTPGAPFAAPFAEMMHAFRHSHFHQFNPERVTELWHGWVEDVLERVVTPPFDEREVFLEALRTPFTVKPPWFWAPIGFEDDPWSFEFGLGDLMTPTYPKSIIYGTASLSEHRLVVHLRVDQKTALGRARASHLVQFSWLRELLKDAHRGHYSELEIHDRRETWIFDA